MHWSAQFRASPDEVRGRLSKLRGDLTNSLSTRWVYLLTFCVGNGQKKLSEAEQFFLVVWSQWQCSFYVWWRKNFSACEQFFLTHSDILLCPTAFGWGLGWPNAPWLCEWWCSHTWDGHGMAMGVSTGNIPKGGSRGLKVFPSVTAPALAKSWHASAMLPSPQPHAVAEEICEKKTFTGWKVFSLGTG